MELKSRHYEASDTAEAMELCSAKGWTDGLPVVPPTEARISAMLAASGLEPDLEIAFIENRQVSVTAEKVAINAVLERDRVEELYTVGGEERGELIATRLVQPEPEDRVPP